MPSLEDGNQLSRLGGSVPNRNVTGPRAGQPVSSGADQLWSTGQQASVEPSPAERDDKSTAWPDIAPQLSDDAADQKAFAISADQTPGGYYSTVALIDRNGSWRRSMRSIAVNVYAYVSPDTEAGAESYSKKAHCNNSSNATVYFITCAESDWYLAVGNCV